MKHFVLGSRYYFTLLTDYEKKIYRKIYDSWVTGGCEAKVTAPGLGFKLPSGRTIHDLVNFIIQDNPHLFHLETTHFRYQQLGPVVLIQSKSVYTQQEYDQIYEKLIQRVEQIVAMAKQYPTDLEKLRFLHDYLAKNLTYDYGAPDPRSQREIHTIVGALLNGRCVCDGYARAFRLLCDYLHLSCIVALGEGINNGVSEHHAWNYVKINKKVYHVDVTWDSNLMSYGSPVTDHYFMRSDAVFSKDHQWDTTLYHPVPEDCHQVRQVIRDKWELETYICDRVKAGQTQIVAYLDESFPGQEAINYLLPKIMERNRAVFQGTKGCSVAYHDKFSCVDIVVLKK